MKLQKILLASAAIVLAYPAPSWSHDMPHGAMSHKMATGPIAVEAPWARASITKNGAAYAKIVNKGDAADRLVDVKSPVAKRVELHTHIMDGNIMRMRRIEGGLALAPGETVTMKPGGNHVMLIGLTKKLVEGERFPVTFVFEKAGEIEATVTIGKLGAMKSGGKDSGNMGSGGMKMDHGHDHGGHTH